MRRFINAVAIITVGFASAGNAQQMLTSEFTLKERTPDGVNEASAGRIFIYGTSSRMDVRGKSSLSRLDGTDLGDSVTVISIDTGSLQVLTILNHHRKEYVQFNRSVASAKLRDRNLSAPGVSQIDFAGSSVTVDSLGAGDEIAGYKTRHYRFKASLRAGIAGNPIGGQDVTADFFIAPALSEFAQAGDLLETMGSEQFSLVPGIPKSFLSQLEAANKDVRPGLSLRTVVDWSTSMFGTGLKSSMTFQMLKVQRAAPDSALFTIPTGYARVVPRGMDYLLSDSTTNRTSLH